MIVIVANGRLEGAGALSWLASLCEAAALVVAADGGLAHLRAANRWPDVLVGDMDSAPADAVRAIAARGGRVERHPATKDETDLELALLAVCRQRPVAEPIRIAAALGGRPDQMLANVFLLALPALEDRDVRLVEPHLDAWLVREQATIIGDIGDLVSLLPLAGPAHVRSTEGLAWALREEWLTFGPARGISNRLSHDRASVQVGEGTLLCIHTRGETA